MTGTGPYGASSPFNQPVDKTRVHSNSAAMVNYLTGQGFPERFWAGATGPDDWYTASYCAKAGDPVLTLARQYGTAPNGAQIKCPANARAPQTGAADRDGSVVILQPDGTEYGLYEAIFDWPNHKVTAKGAYYAPANTPGIHLSNACAAEFGLRAGNVTGPDLQRGLIDSALITVIDYTNGGVVEPAWHANSRSSSASSVPLGQRFFSTLSIAEIDALSVPAWQKTIMKAVSTYGVYVRDTGGGSFKPLSHEMYASLGTADPLVDYAKAHVGEGIVLYNGRYVFTFVPVDWKLRASA